MLSVIICTWNRSTSLRETLASIERMRNSTDIEWEVIVVDNNSTDDTASTIDEFLQRLPLKHLFEPNAGKSHALNTAIKAASGKHLVFTDDDVLVAENWLMAYADAFARHPEHSLFGGSIEPLFLGTNTPMWLKSGFNVVANAYAIIESKAATGPVTRDSYPYGANMAAHRRVFENHSFATEVGPRPGSRVRGEEMMLIWEALDAGQTGVWVPEATVQHAIPIARQNLTYLRDYYLGSGELMDLLDEKDLPKLFGRPRWAWRVAIAENLKFWLTRYISPSPVWLAHFRKAFIARGLLNGFKQDTAGTNNVKV